jgi:hypothetical protein
MKITAIVMLALALICMAWLLLPRQKPAPEAIEIVKAAQAKADIATQEAAAAEVKAVGARPRARAAKEALQEKIEIRIASSINLDGLPAPVLAEFEAMRELVDAMEAQLEFETRRGDMWRDAALAQQELVSVLQGQQENLTKAAHRKGLKWGAIGGAAAVILLVALI